MSARQQNPADTVRKLAYLTRDYLPEARWTVGGAFRFDFCLRQAIHFFAEKLPIRKLNQLAGAPPCLWSLDWFSQRRPISGPAYIKLLDTYTKEGIGLTLVFDNPFIRPEHLQDPYALFLVAELVRRNAAHQHAVCVANDQLAELLRRQFPALPIYCHVNRLLAEPASTRRDAAFYSLLGRRYNRICLHPEDAVNPAVFTTLAEPGRMDVIINDPCLRGCPFRQQHVQILADYRREPYNPTHSQRRVALLNQAACLRIDSSGPQQKKAGNLTKAECRALYAAGFRSFVIQSQQFANEMTLMWDISQCLFASSPELSNKVALINASLLAALNPKPRLLASGLSDFSTSELD